MHSQRGQILRVRSSLRGGKKKRGGKKIKARFKKNDLFKIFPCIPLQCLPLVAGEMVVAYLEVLCEYAVYSFLEKRKDRMVRMLQVICLNTLLHSCF